MAGISALHSGLSGIRTARTGLDTAGNNVANAETEGYTRQRVEQSSRPTTTTPAGPVGTGVQVDGVARLRDGFLDERVRATSATAEHADARAELLERAERVLAEPDDGVTGALTDVFDAFADLGNDPADAATRQQVLTALDSLAGRFGDVRAGLDALATDAGERIADRVDRANRVAGEIAEVNARIADTGQAEAPPDLADERDRLADELADLVGARVAATDDGSFRVAAGGLTLVDDTRAHEIAWDADERALAHPSGEHLPRAGEVGGLVEGLAADVPALTDELDELADTVAAAFNEQHRQGYVSPSGDSGDDLFTGEGAGGIAVADGLTADDLATAGDADAAPHDGRGAQALAALRDEPVADDGTRDADGTSLAGRAREVVGGLASRVRGAADQAAGQRALADTADQARRGEHGVSIDEEMVSLMSHQRAFEAASRVVTTADEALDTLVNRTGVVGR